MIIAVIGSGGKTSLIRALAAQYRSQGKTVFVTTTTHMFVEPDTILTEEPAGSTEFWCSRPWAQIAARYDTCHRTDGKRRHL